MAEIELKYYPDVDTWVVEYEYGKTRSATEQEVTLWKELLDARASVSELEAAGENILGQLHQREDELRRAVMKIAELEAQVKAMRCCGNCQHEDRRLDLELTPCHDCTRGVLVLTDKDNWQPRPASKEG